MSRSYSKDVFDRKNIDSTPNSVTTAISYISIYTAAKNKNYWIYDPSIKRWLTPEEFKEIEDE